MGTSIHLTFVEGSSAKFWQAEQQETQIRLRWGRLGTSGQEQVKDFASSAEAAAFMHKQAESKRKKGYQESVEGQAAPAPAPKTAPAQPTATASAPPSHEVGAVAWTPALRHKKLVYCWQDGIGETTVLPPAYADAASAWKSLRQPIKGLRIQRVEPASHQALFEQVRELGLRGVAPEEVSPELAAALVDLVPTRGCIDWLWLSQGPAACLQAALDALHGRLEWGWPDSRWIWEPVPWQGQMFKEQASWLALQARIQTMEAEAYQDLRATAAEIFAQAPLMQQILLAFCFPQEEAWIHSAAQAWSAGFQAAVDVPSEDLGFLLWPLLRDRDLQRGYLKHYRALPKYSFQRGTVTAFVGYWAFWLVEYAAGAAAPSLAGWVRYGETAALRKSAAEALSLLQGAEGWQAMVSLLDTREGNKWFPDKLLANPSQTLPIVLEYCAAHPEAAEAERLLAKLALTAQPSQPLSPAAQTLWKQLHPDQAPSPSLAADALPAWVHSPPWSAKQRPQHVPLELELSLAGAALLPFAPGQFHGLQPYVHGKPPALPTRDREVQADLDERWAKGKLHLDDLDRLSHTAALNYLNQTLPLQADGTYDAERVRKHKGWYSYSDSGWDLACTLTRFGLEGWPGLVAWSWAHPKGFAVLYHLVSPALAFTHLQGLAYRETRAGCAQWLHQHAAIAVRGLAPLALGPASAYQQQAAAFVRQWQRRYPEAVAEGVRVYAATPGWQAAWETLLGQDPIQDLPARMPKLPTWLNTALLPTLKGATGESFPASAWPPILTALALSSLYQPYIGVTQLAQVCDPGSLGQVALNLMHQWIDQGAPAAQEWMLHSLAHWGDPLAIAELEAAIGRWPGERAHARAILGVEVLAEQGTEAALCALQTLMEKSRFAGLRDACHKALSQIAARRGQSLQALLDALLPDLDLAADGSYPIAWGEQTYCARITSAGGLALYGPDGKPVRTLPKGDPTQEKAWKQQRKRLEQALSLQAQRLERAMIHQQSWSAEAYQRLCQHPLTAALVKALIWGWRSAPNQPWEPLPADRPAGEYRLMHPLELQAEPQRWQAQEPGPQVFPQRDREVFVSQPEDWSQLQPSRWQNRQVSGPGLWKLSQGGRWRTEDEGGLVWRCGAWEISLACEYQSWAWRENKQCEIFALQVRGPQGQVPPGQLDPILFSEVLRDLGQISL